MVVARRGVQVSIVYMLSLSTDSSPDKSLKKEREIILIFNVCQNPISSDIITS